MKATFCLFYLLFALHILAFSQAVDTAAVVREVDSLLQVSKTLTDKRKFAEALVVNAAAEKLVMEKLGKESASYGSACFHHGRALFFKGEYKEAEKWYIESKEVRLKILGKEHRDYALCLNNLGVLYGATGQYEKAADNHLEALAIREKVLGKNSMDYIQSLNNLSNVFWKTGKYEESELYGLQAQKHCENLLGKEHASYATITYNLALLYKQTGQYEKAESAFIDAKATLEKTVGKEHTEYAYCLNNLANLYRQMGDYEKSEALGIESKNILEKSLGKNHPEYANSIYNLSALYRYMNNTEKAEILLLEALSVFEGSSMKDHNYYANILNGLASLYTSIQRFEKAEPLHIESLSIKEKKLGKEHPDYAMGLNGLANLYKRSGLYEKAESIYKESLSILEKALGQDHHDYAMVLKNLANLYFTTNQLDRSEYYYKEALPKYQSILGNEHQDYIQNLYELSLVYWATGKHTLTQTLLLQSESGMQSNLIKAVRHLSEIELSAYHGRFIDITDYVFSLADIRQEITPESYSAILFHKGFILNTSIRANKLALKSPATNHNLLKSYHRRLAAEYAKPLADRKNVAELEEKANTLEKELVRTVAGYGEAIRQVNWQEVQSALKPGEAAIEFVRFHYYTPKPTDSVLYAALILTPGMSAPVFVGLFEEKQLDALLAPQAQKGSSGFNELYGGVTSRTLYRLLWAPLESHLAGVKTVYFSPAGQLYRLNIGAITNSEGKTLSDRFQLVRLNSTRQLVESSRMEAPATAVVFGGIRFDMDSTAYHTRAIPAGDKRRGPSFEQSDSTLRGGDWQYLKWSDKEADNVGAMLSKAGLSVTTRKGWDATEEAFKQLGKGAPSPRILHLSTHGFFFPDPERDAASGAILADHEPVFKISDHPMIRSGLVLAGGNHAWRTGKPLGEREDGILTAYEISQMDLSHTELVVLSACETGLGQIEGNEGVYGLQRAFKIAGAKNLVMSLWQVPDYQTQELMSAFYRNLTEGKMQAREALQAAQNEMRQKRYEPYYWAGFILVE